MPEELRHSERGKDPFILAYLIVWGGVAAFIGLVFSFGYLLVMLFT